MPNTREKLIELLDSFNSNISKYAGDPKFFMVDENLEIADHLIANGVTVLDCPRDCTNCWKTKLMTPRWIPVDEPPKKNGYYLVYTESGEIIRGYYKGYYWLVGNDVVTHWMYLPQPPKGE